MKESWKYLTEEEAADCIRKIRNRKEEKKQVQNTGNNNNHNNSKPQEGENSLSEEGDLVRLRDLIRQYRFHFLPHVIEPNNIPILAVNY